MTDKRKAQCERAHGDCAAAHGGTGAARARGKLPGSEPRLARAAGAAGGASLPALQGAQVHPGLPGAGQYPALHRLPGGGRPARRRRTACWGDNALPAVTGRVCPQETQCEELCVRGVKGARWVGYLERFVADWARHSTAGAHAVLRPSGKRVAVVGSGPAGLTAAGELVTIRP